MVDFQLLATELSYVIINSRWLPYILDIIFGVFVDDMTHSIWDMATETQGTCQNLFSLL